MCTTGFNQSEMVPALVLWRYLHMKEESSQKKGGFAKPKLACGTIKGHDL